jgi:hypothetical protein
MEDLPNSLRAHPLGLEHLWQRRVAVCREVFEFIGGHEAVADPAGDLGRGWRKVVVWAVQVLVGGSWKVAVVQVWLVTQWILSRFSRYKLSKQERKTHLRRHGVAKQLEPAALLLPCLPHLPLPLAVARGHVL